ncbi:hypothetical protein D918_09667 [Trichuris suis]|nr:hypothetical protein D918_09667 [Trichuris suis]
MPFFDCSQDISRQVCISPCTLPEKEVAGKLPKGGAFLGRFCCPVVFRHKDIVSELYAMREGQIAG